MSKPFVNDVGRWRKDFFNMGISPFDFNQMQARLNRNAIRDPKEPFEAAKREVGQGGLHSQIEAECRQRMWVVVHSRTDRKSTTEVGSVDFVIAADNGRIFWIECKAGKSKQTIDQKGVQMMLERNGHKYHLVRSFEEFLEVVKNKK